MSFIKEFFWTPFEEFLKHKELIFYQVKAEFKERHVSRALGPIWWFGQPLLMSLLFVFVTTVLFKTQFTEHHMISIIMAVLVWQWFIQTTAASPDLLLSFQGELTATNLPILPLMFAKLLVETMIFGFSLIIIFIGLAISGVELTVNVVYLPILIILQFVMITAFISHFARIGLFFRDLSQVLWFFLSIWFFISPGAYPKILIPEQFAWMYDLNPWATIFPAWRDVLVIGQEPNLLVLGIWFLVFVPIALWGLWKINKSRTKYYRGF